MATKNKGKRTDPLDQLIKGADAEILGQLIKKFSAARPDIRRECFEFLKDHVSLTPSGESVSAGEAMFAIWMELESDLSDLDEYGGGDYELADHVGEVLTGQDVITIGRLQNETAVTLLDGADDGVAGQRRGNTYETNNQSQTNNADKFLHITLPPNFLFFLLRP